MELACLVVCTSRRRLREGESGVDGVAIGDRECPPLNHTCLGFGIDWMGSVASVGFDASKAAEV